MIAPVSTSDFQPTVAICHHSGFGHTAVLADAVRHGADTAGARVSMIAIDGVAAVAAESDWAILDDADAIVFGSPTYMGNVSAAFQTFAEQTGRRCMNGTWRDKVAAGFTNSGAKSGDKLSALISMTVFAAQHHMHWVSLGLPPGWNSTSGSEHDLNRLGFWLGAATQTDVDANPDQVHPADIATCEHLGRRVAMVTRQMVAGRAVAPPNSAVSTPEAWSAPAR